jgi:hypothetical protein
MPTALAMGLALLDQWFGDTSILKGRQHRTLSPSLSRFPNAGTQLNIPQEPFSRASG